MEENAPNLIGGDDAEKVIPGYVTKGLLLHVYSTGKGNSLARSKQGER